jgi:hypothetical protein
MRAKGPRSWQSPPPLGLMLAGATEETVVAMAWASEAAVAVTTAAATSSPGAVAIAKPAGGAIA